MITGREHATTRVHEVCQREQLRVGDRGGGGRVDAYQQHDVVVGEVQTGLREPEAAVELGLEKVAIGGGE